MYVCSFIKYENYIKALSYQISNEVNKLMKIKSILSTFVFASLIFHYLRSLS